MNAWTVYYNNLYDGWAVSGETPAGHVHRMFDAWADAYDYADQEARS